MVKMINKCIGFDLNNAIGYMSYLYRQYEETKVITEFLNTALWKEENLILKTSLFAFYVRSPIYVWSIVRRPLFDQHCLLTDTFTLQTCLYKRTVYMGWIIFNILHLEGVSKHATQFFNEVFLRVIEISFEISRR